MAKAPSDLDKKRRKKKRGSGGGAPKMRRARRPVRETWNRFLEADLIWGVLFVIVGLVVLAPSGLFLSPNVEEGSIAARDFLATRDVLVLDRETTAAKKERAERSILPVYDFDYAKASEQDEQFARLFEIGREVLADSTASAGVDGTDFREVLRQRILSGTSIRMADELLAEFSKRRFSADLEDRMRSLARAMLRSGVVANKPLLLENRLQGVTVRSLQSGQERVQLDLFAFRGHPNEVAEYLEVELGRWTGWTRKQRSQLLDFLVANVPPNVYLNLSETEARKQAARDLEEEVFNQVQRGQVIVRKGDAFDASAVAVLREMTGDAHRSSLLLPFAGNLLLLILAAIGLWFGLKRSRLAEGIDKKTFGGVGLLLIFCLLLFKGGVVIAHALANSFDAAPFNSEQSYLYAIPFGVPRPDRVTVLRPWRCSHLCTLLVRSVGLPGVGQRVVGLSLFTRSLARGDLCT